MKPGKKNSQNLNKNTEGPEAKGITLVVFNIYHKVLVARIAWCWLKNRHRDHTEYMHIECVSGVSGKAATRDGGISHRYKFMMLPSRSVSLLLD